MLIRKATEFVVKDCCFVRCLVGRFHFFEVLRLGLGHSQPPLRCFCLSVSLLWFGLKSPRVINKDTFFFACVNVNVVFRDIFIDVYLAFFLTDKIL